MIFSSNKFSSTCLTCFNFFFCFLYPGKSRWTASVDPDFNGTERLDFAWYCKDVFDAKFDLNTNLSHEPVVSEHDTVGIPYVNGVGYVFCRWLLNLEVTIAFPAF